METTDIVIHKGEKEEKYQLYVEDYVMSYLKNYGGVDGRNIFFYGTREKRNKKYYIYGAGKQKNISYFVRYELLDEIVYRCDADMPAFFIKEESGRYEVKGYYIFYQSNEAMQSYMVEQKKAPEYDKKTAGTFNSALKNRPQDFSDIRARTGIRDNVGSRTESIKDNVNDNINKNSVEGKTENLRENISQTRGRNRTGVRRGKKAAGKFDGGILAFQLCAVFLVMAAIVINSTNSYTKLKELSKSAVEVFFTMENQEAADEIVADETKEEAGGSNGAVLTLADLDAEFEKENQTAKKEESNEENKDENLENADESDINLTEAKAGNETEDEINNETEDETENEIKNKTDSNGKPENDAGQNSDKTEEGDADEDKSIQEEGQTETGKNPAEENDDSENAPKSQEAFARNFANYYKIEKGDTLCNISIKIYGDASKVKEICEINKIDNPDNIKYGQKILLP